MSRYPEFMEVVVASFLCISVLADDLISYAYGHPERKELEKR